jgi:hypothetical protein
MLGTDDTTLERPLPPATEAPSRERLRWEKELLGFYLSEHPLTELAAEMADYVDAWSAEVGEGLDQQRIVVGGMVVGVRRVITRNRESMAVATLEDLQGTVDVVVFPRVYAETGPTWAEDAVLLVAGRVDDKGDETVVLADSVWTWEAASDLGVERFRAAVAAGDRGRRGRGGRNGNGPGRNGNGPGRDGREVASIGAGLAAVPVEAGAGSGSGPGAGWSAGSAFGAASGRGVPGHAAERPVEVIIVPRVSPLRGSQPDGTLEVVVGGPLSRPGPVRSPAPRPDAALPVPTIRPAPAAARPPAPDDEPPLPDDEPPLPEEVLGEVARAASAATMPLEAGPDQVLHVRFAAAPSERIAATFDTLRGVIRSRPGATPVVLHIPAGGGRAHEMRLGVGIAYDADLVAEVSRRFGGLLELRLA